MQAQGNDIYRGGAGTDQISYYARNAGVTVFLNGVAEDGAANEYDNVMPDVENVSGTNYNDYIVGSSANNVLNGYGGDDFLIGGNGNDSFDDGLGNDSSYGQGGDDVFTCDSAVNGDDYFSGGDGIDTVTYSLRNAGVTAVLDIRDHGWSGREDLIDSDVENLNGTRFNDTLQGNRSDNVILGYGGSDHIEGGFGSDRLFGGDGNDDIWFDGNSLSNFADGGNGYDVVQVLGTGPNDPHYGTYSGCEEIWWSY